MAIKGICRSCFGDVFESDEKVNAVAEQYHICWREEEVCASICLSVCACGNVWAVVIATRCNSQGV